jgi:tRNA threonylcarbamoyl adenosine modification protein (Sua5/YciO/YrdC/YwlC family)
MRVVGCDSAGLDAAADTLLKGGVAVIPTDTVYGLAAHPDFPAAVDRLYTIKGRSEKKPIALLVSGVDAVERRGFCLPARAAELARRHWPGGLTLVLSDGASAEGFRVPDFEWTRRLIERCGGALKVTSANLSGSQAAVEAAQALDTVGLSSDIVVDGGVSPGGVASTVVDARGGDEPVVLRRGAVDL